MCIYMVYVSNPAAVDCVDLADPMNGQVTVTPDGMATVDTDLCAVATYACSEGYSLVGDATRTCQANGQWDGAEPSCECKHLVFNHLVTLSCAVIYNTQCMLQLCL